ncbi:MAG: 5'-methylthioadenosine/S-adenosylhomocysteine nucleosidase [Bacilli bacterium]|nr:5'-methylthioadenosine/S-adenosylhomocysteine nucleosidase [Bacilli bacterium]
MTILIQGAMKKEINELIKVFSLKLKRHEGYQFYRGHHLIVSLTKIGTVNASKATRLAIKYYRPTHVFNIGLCGAHVKNLHPNHLIIGDVVTYIKAKQERLILKGTPSLIRLVDQIPTKLKLTHAIMGSANLFTKDEKTIQRYQKICQHVSEDMESIASYYECESENIPHLAIRIISNNEITHEDYETYHRAAAHHLQVFIEQLINVLRQSDN